MNRLDKVSGGLNFSNNVNAGKDAILEDNATRSFTDNTNRDSKSTEIRTEVETNIKLVNL